MRACPCLTVIVSSAHWESHLPDIVEAIVIVGSGAAHNAREQKARERKARQVHTAFLRNYGRNAAQTPLVRFDAAANYDRPFTEVGTCDGRNCA